MATTKGTAIAAPQIFGTDPVEQTYAKGTLENDNGGLAYAFLNAARSDRAGVQDRYMQSLRESNLMASRLAQMEIEGDLDKELIKSMAEQANAGIDPSTILRGNRIYKDVYDPLTRQPAYLSRDKKAAEAAKLRADAAGGGGGGDGVKVEITHDYGPAGSTGDTREKISGKNAAAVIAAAEERRKARAQSGSGHVLHPDGTTGPPTTPDARRAALPPGTPGSQTGVGSNAREQGNARRADEARRQQEAKERAEANTISRRLDDRDRKYRE